MAKNHKLIISKYRNKSNLLCCSFAIQIKKWVVAIATTPIVIILIIKIDSVIIKLLKVLSHILSFSYSVIKNCINIIAGNI